jgi:hypothetical protein
MSGHKREKRIGGLAALALLLLTFTICTTGAIRAKPYELKPGEFTGVVTNPIVVTCAPGATTGTGEMQVKVARSSRTPGNFKSGDTVKALTASWPGGGSLTINKFDRFFGTGPGATFPCPAGLPTIRPASFHSSPPIQLAAFHSAAPARTLLAQTTTCPPGQTPLTVTINGVPTTTCTQAVAPASAG